MIFLIDDKKLRQSGYGWDDDKFEQVKEYIIPIYNYEQILEENISNTIFKPGNIVLFHESFFDTAYNKHEKDSLTIRTKLEKYAKSSEDFSVAFFSGSKNSRFYDKNVINLPVSTLYANLEIFIYKYSNGNSDLRFLLFGENPDIEEYLTQALEIANQNLDSIKNYESLTKNLYLKPSKNFIQKPLLEFDEKIIFKVSDKDLNEKVLEWLNEKKYDNIFIPLCFGSILSDYNGLRLALHVRTSPTISQFANIFIYGIVDHSFLLHNDYYDVLKTKNVRLIDYKRSSFKDALFLNLSVLNMYDLSVELDKIKLNPPGHYFDNHSIANEWSIMRWFKTILKSEIIDYTPDEIESIESKINSNLYYKYLTCKFPINNVQGLTVEDLKLKFNGKILYIDDEKDKGWNELFCTLLYDNVINKVEDYESFGSEFKELEKDEIINLSVSKAKDFDLVILDFRLTEDDFYESDPKKITGYKILEGIKAHNKGIQVVIFSATNKVWNLQALQDAGADGFIIKESPENSTDAKFTFESITNLIKTIDKCFSLKIKKELVELHKSILKNLLVDEIDENPRYNFFLKGLLKQAAVIEKSIVLIDFNHPITLDITFLSCYNFLEQFRDYYLIEGKDFRYYLGFEELPLNRITIQKKSPRILSNGEFIKNGRNDNPSWFQVIAGLFIDYFNLSSAPFNEVVDLHNMSTSRNRYIHEDKSSFNIGEIRIVMTLTELATRNLKE